MIYRRLAYPSVPWPILLHSTNICPGPVFDRSDPPARDEILAAVKEFDKDGEHLSSNHA